MTRFSIRTLLIVTTGWAVLAAIHIGWALFLMPLAVFLLVPIHAVPNKTARFSLRLVLLALLCIPTYLMSVPPVALLVNTVFTNQTQSDFGKSAWNAYARPIANFRDSSPWSRQLTKTYFDAWYDGRTKR